jgi:hypothetical protein
MASSARVTVLSSTGDHLCTIKLNQALGRIEQCISAWVEEGRTIRDLTLAERVQARSEQAKRTAGLVYYVEGKDGVLVERQYLAECHGLKVVDIEDVHQELRIASEANRFAESAA